MPIVIPGGFQVVNLDPIDSRVTVADQSALLGFSSVNVYEGLVVYQRDTNELYVLTDTGSWNNISGWQLVGSGAGGVQSILSGSNSTTFVSASSNLVGIAVNGVTTQTNTSSSITFYVPVTGSIFSGSFSGSFSGDGSGLIGVTATPTFPVSAKLDLASTDKFFINDDGSNQTTGNKQITYADLLNDLAGTNLTVDSSDSLTLSSLIVGLTSVTSTAFTGSLQGTSSWATNSLTASLAPNYVLNSATSSFVTNSQTSSFVTNFQTSSFVTNSQTSSFVTNSQTSSFVQNSQTASMSVLSASFAATASLAPNYVLNSATSSFIINSQTSSFVQNSQTSSMLAPYVLNSQTSSFVTNSQTSSFRTGSFTGSFTGNFAGTASWATNSVTASYVTSSNVWGPTGRNSILSSSYALTASYSVTSSFAFSSSLAITALTASFIASAIVGNNIDNNILTATGGGTINGESNLTFDGSLLNLTGRLNSTGPITGSGFKITSAPSGVDNTVLVLNSNNDVVTDEIDPRVWGNSLVDYSGTPLSTQIAYFTDADTIAGTPGFTFNAGTNLFTTPNVLITGDITVLGTASFQEATNLTVRDRFILLASGSNSGGDGGIIIQQATQGIGEVFGFDEATTRWGVTGSLNATETTFIPDAFMSTVYTGATISSIPSRYSANGNIFIQNNVNGDIWIYS